MRHRASSKGSGPHILLIRTSALGDVVHTLPVLTALRRHLPAARLGWVIEEALAPLLAGHPDLDALLPVATRRWRRQPLAPSTLAELAGTRARLATFGADIALDLMGNHKGGVLARLSGARRRIGLARPFRREPSSAVWVNEEVEPRGVHAVDRALALLRPLELPEEEADFGAGKLFAGRQTSRGTPAADYALIHPGAGWGNKVYPPAWWGAVARRLAGEAGLASRVSWGPGEESLARAAAAASDGAAELLPAAGIEGLGAAILGARIVLGGDTGPLHLAHALGRPALFVMGPTDPERHGPYRAPELAVWRRLPCSFCHRRFREAKACLLVLPPCLVAERAAAIVKRGGERPAGCSPPRGC